MQTMYNKLKGRVNAVQVEDAAAHDADNVIHAMTGARFGGEQQTSNGLQRPRAAQLRGQDVPGVFSQRRPGSGSSGGRPSFVWDGQGPRGGVQSADGATPSHRDRLAVPRHSNQSNAFMHQPHAGVAHGNIGLMQPSPARQRLGTIDPNIMPSPGLHGYGMSAGMKVGTQFGGPVNRALANGGRTAGASMLHMR